MQCAMHNALLYVKLTTYTMPYGEECNRKSVVNIFKRGLVFLLKLIHRVSLFVFDLHSNSIGW